MIVVDSSVWIDYFNGRVSAETEVLDSIARLPLVTGDLIMAEVLQGFAAEPNFRRALRIFNALEFREMIGREIALEAGQNYQRLRSRGITVRSTIATFLATFGIVQGHHLLHSDRDFDRFERLFGLKVLAV